MYQDLFLQMDFQTAYTTTAASSKYIDLLAAGDAMDGQTIIFKSFVTAGFSGLVSIQVQLQNSPSSLFGGTCITVAQSAVVLLASLTVATASVFQAGVIPTTIPSPVPANAGSILVSAIPAFGLYRYLQAYVICVGTATGGALTNEIVMNTDKLLTGTLGTLLK